MAKVYCKNCKHVGKIKKSDYVGSWNEKECCHPSCFNGEVAVVDTPFGRKVQDSRERFSDMQIKNGDNNCGDFEEKVGWLNLLLGGKLTKETEDVTWAANSPDVDTDYENQQQRNVSDAWALVTQRDERIVELGHQVYEQNMLMLELNKKIAELEGRPLDEEEEEIEITSNATIFDKIDLE